MLVISSWNVRGFNAIAKHMDLRTSITDRKIGVNEHFGNSCVSMQ